MPGVMAGLVACSNNPADTTAGPESIQSSAVVYTYAPELSTIPPEPEATEEETAPDLPSDEEQPAEPMEPIDPAYLIPAEDGPATASDSAVVLDEIEALRRDFARLEQSVNLMTRTRLNQLQEENRTLRRELQRMYAMQSRDVPYEPPPVPAPGRDLLEELYAEASRGPFDGEPATAAPLPPITGMATASAGPVRYSVVKEWGRTPEEAAGLGAASLKGMVCVVPETTADDALIAFGRTLRDQFAEYDNLNIEIFNNAEVARRYIEENASPGEHRVMVISRHRGTQSDAIVRFKGSLAVPVPLSDSAELSPDAAEPPRP